MLGSIGSCMFLLQMSSKQRGLVEVQTRKICTSRVEHLFVKTNCSLVILKPTGLQVFDDFDMNRIQLRING